MSGWHIYPAETPIFWAMILLLATQTAGHARNVAYLITDMYRRRHTDLTKRAPGAGAVRQSMRPTPTSPGPAMPDEDEVTRIGRPDYGPPRIEPVETQGFPNPGKPRWDRRGLVVGLVALLATVLVLGAAAGAYFLWPRSSSAPTAAAQPLDTANADGCHEFDKAFKFFHDAVKNPAPFSLKLGAEDIMDKVPDAAGLTTGPAKQAMLKTAAAATILAKKEAAFDLHNWSDTDEIQLLMNAWEGVQARCSEAGVTLVNAPYRS